MYTGLCRVSQGLKCNNGAYISLQSVSNRTTTTEIIGLTHTHTHTHTHIKYHCIKILVDVKKVCLFFKGKKVELRLEIMTLGLLEIGSGHPNNTYAI